MFFYFLAEIDFMRHPSHFECSFGEESSLSIDTFGHKGVDLDICYVDTI